MKIVIIGGGNIGTAILADLAAQNKNEVAICTNKTKIFPKEIKYINSETGDSYTTSNYQVSEINSETISQAEIIFITIPAFLRADIINRITPFVSQKCAIGFIPGSGGVEFLCKPLLQKQCPIFGLDRVPFISRADIKTGSVCASKKASVRLAALPAEKTSFLANTLENLLNLSCKTLPNYLTVTFTPSNQILHTSRLYSLFKDYSDNTTYDHNFLFYKEWDLQSSKMLLACDNELQSICHTLAPLDLSQVIPLTIHYESPDSIAMTNKISSIKSLSAITSPMTYKNNGWIPDFNSRYFQEDFPYGLCIIKSFATVCDIKTPNIDKILAWYSNVTGQFCSFNLNRFGIHSKLDIINFYSK